MDTTARETTTVAWDWARRILGVDDASYLVLCIAGVSRELRQLGTKGIDRSASLGARDGGRSNMEIIIALAVMMGFSVASATIWLIMDRRYASRLSAAQEREREFATLAQTERSLRIEAQTDAKNAIAERDMLRGEVLTRLQMKQSATSSDEIPENLSRLAERAASLVLARLPMDEKECERLTLCATLGALITAHNYVGSAVNTMLRRADLEGPIYRLQLDDDAADDEPGSEPGDLQ
jgi:hypothetical protein